MKSGGQFSGEIVGSFQAKKTEINTANIITIKVFDINGKEVKTLVNKKQSAGKYNIEFDGSDLSSGVYFYSLLVENSVVETKRMLLIK